MKLSRQNSPLVLLSLLVAAHFATFLSPALARAETLEADGSLQWRRGNMHTHSHWSDGDDYLEMIALWYLDHHYDFLVFTDHNSIGEGERWIDVKKSKGGELAFNKLKARFPKETQTRLAKNDKADESDKQSKAGDQEQPSADKTNTEDRLEVRLSTFAEVSDLFSSDQLSQPGKLLLIQGEEISDHFKQYPIHMNVSNIAKRLDPAGGRSVLEVMQANVRAAYEQRRETGQPMIIHLNHPNFVYAVTAEDMAQLVGEQFFEVYNGHVAVHNSGDEQHASVERIWDVVLTLRLDQLNLPIMYGLANDDSHDYHHIPSRASEPGRGWVNVLAEQLTPEALIESLEAGRFYASSGVSLNRIETTDHSYSVEVEPVAGETYTIDFIGTRTGYDKKSEPVLDGEGKPIHTTRRYSNDVGETLASTTGTSAQYKFRGDEIYVRARVTSSADHPNPSEVGDKQQAWAQPTLGPAAKKQEPAQK